MRSLAPRPLPWLALLALLATPIQAGPIRAAEAPQTAEAPPSEPASQPTGRIVERVTTAHDPDQEYALYLPTAYGVEEREWPVLLVLDPRGRAVPGVQRFLPAAERHGYVVLSSYQSRSDTLREVNVAVLNALLPEIQKRYSTDTRRLYLAGMSGTAHAAWRFAQFLEPHVAGVIAAGGGVQTRSQGPPGDAAFAWYGLVGTADFNYLEVMELERHLLSSGIDHRVVVFEGRHGWPDFEHTNRALDWMELTAMRRGLTAPDQSLIDWELAQAREQAAEAGDPLEKLRRLRDVVRDFGQLRQVETDSEAVASLEADPELDRLLARQRKLAREESSYRAVHYGRWVGELRDTDSRPPTVSASLHSLRVKSLRQRAANEKDPPDAQAAQRMLEDIYVGLAYYFPQEFEEAEQYERLVRSLEVAVAVFPDRPAAHWQLAIAYVQAGRYDRALEALRRATSFGNVDVPRLRADPVWEPLRGRPEWRALVESVTGR